MTKNVHPPTLLFSSLSAKVALYEGVLESAKRYHGQATLIGADCDPNCPAASNVEVFSPIRALADMNEGLLLEYCKKLELTHIIPTRDGELVFWASNQTALAQQGVQVMVSNKEAIQLCQDKLLFCKAMEKSSIPTIPTSVKATDLTGKRFVTKERNGSASQSIGMDLTVQEAVLHAEKLDNPIFQPMIEGQEFSAETWIGSTGNCHGMVLRWRTKVIDGEAHESEIFENREWEERMRETFEGINGLSGHVLAQVLVDAERNLHLIEINPRLGGASPLALAAGLSSTEWFLLQSENREDEIPKLPSIIKDLKLKKENGRVQIFR
jgi:carbamoyl-phosphate synthase large subunit